jgi:succinate dehydrogenase/fumarate reductase flavoprotein subunit
MPHEITEPARQTPVIAEPQVLVVGAGPTGLGAALGAARAGVDVLLVEKHGCFGGMLTAGSVINIRQYNDFREVIIGGVGRELADRIRAAGGTESVPEEGTYVRHDPEITKSVAQEMVLEAGVRPLLHTHVVGAVTEGRHLQGVIVENKGGRGAILASVVVDASGDGDVIYHAGAAYEKDTVSPQPMTLAFVMGGITCWPQNLPSEVRRRVNEEIAAGTFPTTRPPALFPMWRKGEYYANATRIPGDCTDAWDLTRGEIEGRRQMMALMEWLRANVPGYEQAFLLSSAPQVGLRESRRLKGLYTLTRADILGYADFPDHVARGAYAIDIHQPGQGTEMTYLEPGRSYGIPYRSLVPVEMDGLLAAGRCISADHDALGSVRVMATCLATGHAAGVAAALSAREGVAPRALDVPVLQEALLAQGAILAAPDAA